MRTNARIEKGDLIVDLDDLIEGLSDEQKLELAKTIGFADTYHKTIADLICNDETEDGWGSWSTGENPLQQARLAILEQLDVAQIERQVIKDLIRMKRKAEEESQRHRNAYWELYHWIQSHICEHCGKTTIQPKMPKYECPAPVTEADIDTALQGKT